MKYNKVKKKYSVRNNIWYNSSYYIFLHWPHFFLMFCSKPNIFGAGIKPFKIKLLKSIYIGKIVIPVLLAGSVRNSLGVYDEGKAVNFILTWIWPASGKPKRRWCNEGVEITGLKLNNWRSPKVKLLRGDALLESKLVLQQWCKRKKRTFFSILFLAVYDYSTLRLVEFVKDRQ